MRFCWRWIQPCAGMGDLYALRASGRAARPGGGIPRDFGMMKIHHEMHEGHEEEREQARCLRIDIARCFTAAAGGAG